MRLSQALAGIKAQKEQDMASRKKRERLPEVIRDNWEVRDWTERDAYGTSKQGVSVYRRGTLIAEGPLDGAPYRRARRSIPKGLIADDIRVKLSKKS